MRRVRGIIGIVAVVVGSLTVIGTASPAAASTPVVTPRHGLPYYARVGIHAEKWANTDYTVSECFDSIVGEYCVQVGGGVVPASGILDTSVVLTRRYDLGDGHDLGQGRVIDCAAPDAACEIVVEAQPVPSRQSLTFDPSAPVPVVHVSPNAGLGWSEPVSVTGTGFLPGQALWLTECARFTLGTTLYTPCFGVKHQPHPVVDDEGRFTFTLAARRLVSGAYDCAQVAIDCFVRALMPEEIYRLGPVDAPLDFVDDGVPIVRLEPSGSVPENGGTTHIEVRLLAPATTTLAVSYTTKAAPASTLYDRAVVGADYTAKTSRVRFLPGETRHVIAIPVVDDATRENLEAFVVQISGPFHAPSRTHVVYIHDND